MSDKKIPTLPQYYIADHKDEVTVWEGDIVMTKNELNGYIEEVVKYILEQALTELKKKSKELNEEVPKVYEDWLLSLKEKIIKQLGL